jgi:hypothetical protein
MSGSKSTLLTPDLGRIWSTHLGPNRPKSVPNLSRHYRGSWPNERCLHAAFMVQLRGLPGRNRIINMQFLTDLMKVMND